MLLNDFGYLMRAPTPISIPLTIAALVALGLSGIDRADELTGSEDRFSKQILWIALAVPAMVAAAAIPYRRLIDLGGALFVISMPLLVVVLLMPPRNGARSWIPLGLFDFQPSELAKLGLIMALAQYLRFRENYRQLSGLVVPFLMTLVPLFLILREPDLGSALLFVPVLFAMLFAAGARWRHLASIALLAVACTPVLWMGMNAEQRSRVTSLFSQIDGGPAPKGDGYHQHQSKLVLALGGLYGSELSGTAIDDPVAYHLPAGQTDFVFCLVGERWGLLGTLLTLGLYGGLVAKGLSVSIATQEPYGRLIATGIATLIGTQAVVNTGMTVGLLPITGITLPFMSYGGSSMIASAVAAGLLINVAIRPGYEIAPTPFRFQADKVSSV